uniref:Fibrous sheath CABYR-binding protein n=1 Tax=Sciurus vulgaris TaxID=55149 RepID=A0A8D2B8Q7_SCIVU
MVDKSQQTEVTEKKKHQSISQPTVPKATFSIVNSPENNSSYSDKKYEPFRVSSQLQQTWRKRKHGQEMTDKSLQTDTSAKQKKEVKSFDEPVRPEEKPAGVGEAGPELPESVQGVEITSSLYSVQLKIDRSQQTNCTGDWSMMNIPQAEKVDKEQQTYISEKEIVVISRAGSSFTKSKEGVQRYQSSGKIFVSEHTEFQPTTSSHEEIRQKNISRDSFTQEIPKDTPLILEDGSKQEGLFVKKDASVEIEPLPTEKVLAEGQALPAEETTAEVEPRVVEETLIEVQSATEETLTFDTATTTAEASVAVSPSPVEEPLSVEPLVKIQPPMVEEALSEESLPAKVAPSEELPTGIQLPLAEETPFEVQPTVTKDEFGEAPAKVESEEKAPAEVQPPSAEEAPTEVILEPGLLTTTEAPKEKAPAEPSPKVEPLIAEEGSVEEFLVAVQPPPAEVAPVEIQSPSFGESPIEEAPAETQPPLANEVPAEEAPTEVQSPSLEEEVLAPVQPPPAETEGQDLPAEEATAEVASPKEVLAQIQSPSAEEAFPEEVLSEVQSLLPEEASLEEALALVQSPPAEVASPEEVLAQIQSPPDEEASPEEVSPKVQSPPDEEASPEEIPPKVQSPPDEEASPEEVPPKVQSPPDERAPIEEKLDEEFFTEKALAEVQSVSAKGVPAEDASVDSHLSPIYVVPIEDYRSFLKR